MLSKDFFSVNRLRCAEMMLSNSVAIFCSGNEIRKSADVFYPFFANRNYYYLTGLEEPGAVLVIAKSSDNKVQEFLFVEKKDELYERWFGRRLPESEIYEKSGLNIFDITPNFGKWLFSFIQEDYRSVYLDLHIYDFDDVEGSANILGQEIKSRYAWCRIYDIHTIMTQLRVKKSNEEIREMVAGIDIARNAFIRMMEVAKVGMTEYQLKAEYDYVIGKAGVKNYAFQPIITTGKSNFCIHYTAYSRSIEPGDIILCDAGVNWNGVCSDISRAWPINKWFTTEEENYYRCMLDISASLFKIIHPGMSMRDVYKSQHHIMRKKIVEYGISKNEDEAKKLIWHGGAHHIGFDNHDEVYIEQHPENVLEENMVFAIDVGIYNIDKGIGFRIENDCLVTDSGSRNLTKSIPFEIEELREILEKRNY